jgi:hypothetical protein
VKESQSAINSEATPRLHIAAMGLPIQGGGTSQARLHYPLSALASLPGVRCVYGAGSLVIPPDFQPGILMLSRLFMNQAPLWSALEAKVAQGWVLVTDMDDDPEHWPQYQASGYRAFKGVHAVTVSTPALAHQIAAWNPQVHVLPNALHHIATTVPTLPKNQQRLKVFFGAFNRQKDWASVIQGVNAAALALGDSLEFVVVHDQAFHDALPTHSHKTFHSTLKHDDYLEVLAGCDLALLPLADTVFNRYKSDLKLIECAGAGVVPICSRVVYADNPLHHDFAAFADTADEYARALLSLCKSVNELNRRAALGHAYVASQRTHALLAGQRRDVYLGLLAHRPLLEAQRQARLQTLPPL